MSDRADGAGQPRSGAPTRAGPKRRRAARRTAAPAVGGLVPRDVASRALASITDGGQTLAGMLERLDAAHADLDARDAALARAIVRTAVRRRGDIDWVLSQLMQRALPRRAAPVRAVLRTATAQLLFMRQADHAAVNAAVALLKGQAETGGFAGLANAVLRRLAGEREQLLHRLPVEANTPPWLWQRWRAHYGEASAHALAAAHRVEPDLDLAFAAPGPLPEGARRLPTGGARVAAGVVAEIEGYAQGTWWVQDVAAQLPVTLFGDLEGRSVLDLCAAPGGKTMQLAAAGARVTAVDVDAGRAARLVQNLQRTRLSERVEVVVADARAVAGTYDAVLLDAPCSATGTLRRQPDVAWAKTPADITTLAQLQRELLTHAAQRLAPGGCLVYATCSMEPEEGEAQLAFVAETLPHLHREPVTQGPAAAFATADGAMRTLAHMPLPGGLQGLDGFFAARFRRAD